MTEELCASRLAPDLYAALREEIEAHVAALGAVMRAQARALAPERLLAEMNAVWSRHCEDTQMIRQIVLRLDRGYALEKRSEGVRSVWDLGLHVFASLVVQPEEVYSRLQEGERES